ncbi:hypothetical protein U2F26_16815 [Micromonospora sp. 4G57]|uniref:S1 family peptidase n=1 Tax=Micromonospora sicca TaxID=2202420 RepID=A0ABU5JB21_9ACTN|nr:MULTISPECIES: hypothetical protein [unclassified Micromonospora]MDZ5444384.1 hypothetical protein [Micromonospora sp. 4G57]MDZ5489782.1 hypothetical protein [Micromonospora sp. 4G53]
MRKSILAVVAVGSLAGGSLVGAPAVAAPTEVTLPENAVASFQQMVQSDRDNYTGLTVDERQHVLRVYVPRTRVVAATGAVTRFATASTARPGSALRVEVTPTPYSLRDLDTTMAQIDKAEPWATATRGLRSAWFVDAAAGRVQVGLTKVTPQLRQLARATFGDRVELVARQRFDTAVRRDRLSPGPLHEVARPTSGARVVGAMAAAATPTRLLDVTPYYSGNRIYRTYTQNGQNWVTQCTTAFVVASGSTRQMATAGHCGPTGSVWNQGYLDTSTNTLYRTGTMGTVGRVEWGNNRMDAEVIGGGSYWAGAVYTGPYNSSYAYGVAGSTSLAVGQSVCSDGSFTGENCGVRVSAINACLDLNDNGTIVHVCNQAMADATGPNYLIVQHGDSGGPVYKLASNPNYTLAAGIISGGSSDGAHMNFTQFTNFTSAFGVTIVSGSPA